MRTRFAFIAASVALTASPGLAQPGSPLDALRTVIAGAVIERLGVSAQIEVEFLQTPAVIGDAIAATPIAGARLGQPVRFSVAAQTGRAFSVVARVTAIVPHVVARHAIAADTSLTDADVEWREGALDGVLLQPLPTRDEVLVARSRRAIAAGEVLTRTALVRPYTVRAGDTVSMTVRTGVIEVRGVGRAVSSGYVGDVIRVLAPGTRQPSRARVVAPAAVEILQ